MHSCRDLTKNTHKKFCNIIIRSYKKTFCNIKKKPAFQINYIFPHSDVKSLIDNISFSLSLYYVIKCCFEMLQKRSISFITFEYIYIYT